MTRLLARLLSLRRYLRLSPFDVDTDDGRRAERYRLAAWSMVANVLSQALGMLVVLLGIRWTINYLGSERFGIWMTITSLTGLLSFLDFGFGNALINHISKASTRNERPALAEAASGGLAVLLLVAAAVGITLSLLAQGLPWQDIFAIKNQDQLVEAVRAVAIFCLLFALNIFSGGVQKIFHGLQLGYKVHIAASSGYLISIVLLTGLTSAHAEIPELLLATFGVQAFSPLLLLASLRRRGLLKASGIIPAIKKAYGSLSKSGNAFFWLQIAAIVCIGADTLIIANVAGPSAVAVFVVLQRLFQFISIPLNLINSPFWAAYADAHARNDRLFIRHTLRTNLLGTAITATAGCSAVLLLGPMIVDYWTSNSVKVDAPLLLLFSIWTVLETTGSAFAIFMNAVGLLKPQLTVAMWTTPLTLGAKIVAATLFGIPGMMATTIAIYSVSVIWFYAFLFRRDFSRVLNDHAEHSNSLSSQCNG